MVERTNKAGVRREKHSEKTESYRENLWNEIQLKGPQRQKQSQGQNQKGENRVVLTKGRRREVKEVSKMIVNYFVAG